MRKIMVKVNDRYIPRFQLTTTILEDERTGERRVEKRPLTPAAAEHVANLARTPALLRGVLAGAELLPCRMEGDAAVFPYVQGSTLLERLLKAAEESREASLSLWKAYIAAIRPAESAVCRFTATPEFEAVFGPGDAWAGEPAYPCCAVDMLPSNVMATDDGRMVLFDYEWLMETPVPAALILYHAINTCYVHHPALNRGVSREEALALAGVDGLTAAGEAEACFYRYISTDENNPRCVWDLYRPYEKPVEDEQKEIERLTNQLRREEKERLEIIAGWNKEHAHALEIDQQRAEAVAGWNKERERALEIDQQRMALEEEKAALLAEREALTEREAQAREENDGLHVKLYEANNREFTAQQEIARLQAETARQAAEQQLLLGSISWRVTRPLRSFKTLLRKLLRRA